MKRYLVRCGILPTEQIMMEEILNKDLTGTNTGNYVYLYSIIRALMTDDTVQFESTRYRYQFKQKEIDRFNKEFDGFIIPLADAFRDSFKRELIGLTETIRALKIPCYVIGVGVSENIEKNYEKDGAFSFEDEARDFIEAVLEKSSMIGVRGQSTAHFLEYLGFKPDKDFCVIGCPSMYTWGDQIHIRDTKIDYNCKAAYNATMKTTPETIQFVEDNAKKFSDIYFVPQNIEELQTMYWGSPNNVDATQEDVYPTTLSHPIYAQDRVRIFLHVNEWMEFLRKRDFTFGTRLHGNIMSILSGTPSVMIAKDIRMRELAKYHGLAYVKSEDLSQYQDILEIVNSVDLHAPEKKQKENFEHYLDFLHANDLQTIFDQDRGHYLPFGEAPLDLVIAGKHISYQFKPATQCTPEEIANRMFATITYQKKRLKSVRNENFDLKHSNKSLKKSVHSLTQSIEDEQDETAKLSKSYKICETKKLEYENILKTRTVRYAVKIRNLFFPEEKKISLPDS